MQDDPRAKSVNWLCNYITICTLPSQKYGNPLKKPIYYDGKVPFGKMSKKSPLLAKEHNGKACKYQSSVKFSPQDNFLSGARKLREI